MALKLHTVICSTRPGRVGERVARWFDGIAKGHDGFDAELIDLAAFDLPIFDEPKHPRLGDYQHDHTKRWSASVASADAFVFVMPEYNHLAPPSLVNALDYLVNEWAYKPCGLVSYGGVSAGLRAAQSIKPMLTALKMMPIPEAVAIPSVAQHLTGDTFLAGEPVVHSSGTLLNELHRWAVALKTLRAA